MNTQVSKVFELCEARNWRLSVAESCTGGGLGALLTAQPGASNYFWGGVISYSNDTKIRVLDVNPETLRYNGAVSEEVAREMAMGVQRLLDVEIGLSVTGVAGPGAEGPKPEGRVCFGLCVLNRIESFTEEFGAIGRENVRHAASEKILQAFHQRFSA